MGSKTNYRKMSTNVYAENVSDQSADIADESVNVDESKVISGVVSCSRLNIRTAPDLTASILGTLTKGTTVIIHDEVGEFYKIGNPDGNEYCMKKYISINQ